MSSVLHATKHSKTALVIIDVQIGLLTNEMKTHNANELLLIIKDLIQKAREAYVHVIFIQHNGGPGHILEPNTSGWVIHPMISPQNGEKIIHKRYPDSFQDTSLRNELNKLDIQELIIAGLQTEWCIDTTIRRAYSLGYNVTVVEDGHSTSDYSILKASKIIEHHNYIFSGWFAKLKKAKEIEFNKH